jgi:2-iminobutanoate/2-iminopropanoate deaminase
MLMLNRQKAAAVVASTLLLSVALIALAQSGQRQPAGVASFMNPPTISRPVGYSHVAEVRGGKVIYIAGQVALDRAGNLVGPGDFRAQAQQAFENVKSALEASGATFKDVVKLNNYLVDISQLAAFRDVRDKYINTATPPASTTVEVRKLFRDDVLIEVEAIAVIP